MNREYSDLQDEAVLQSLGYRKTPQRLLILSVLQAARRRLTIWQILELVHERSPGVSSSTVYRSLEILEAANLVRRTLLPGEGITYQSVRACGGEYYLVCQRCHTIIPFASDLLPALAQQLEERQRFHAVKTATIATGYCDECWPVVRQAT